ncbi:protein-L-isoaspartate(D-aspartate) O-methyltransferase [Streptomyces sp. HNM0663]|uniref:Protein-L-isoaspartate O-methyltransferase n=1 Tax=Streptomyces chengmaiensis TaxID=3040919 RepID=A0ABT6HJK1_9ACTN|nr:protein-L-isoaspartate(D-aspartate) O-methyltransferase [Streptomyces chengmaiensis]MDH2388890.1 protein-L-isoaspartate(D-aspartate) O-methyltransferase [Streptomyces chengmaiensis]
MTGARSPEDLVRTLRAVGIRDERLLRAVRDTPRSGFVPAEHAALAYEDVPVPIGHGQVTTQPSLSAMMIEALGLRGGEHVLEIGGGLGFQTALLARLAADAVSVELLSDVAAQARRNLALQGVRNVDLRVGDGSGGAPDRAPYDAVIVSAAFPEVPPPLAAQMMIGGRLVQPIGPGGREEVVCFRRTESGLARVRVLTAARFVPLRGRYGYPSSGQGDGSTGVVMPPRR